MHLGTVTTGEGTDGLKEKQKCLRQVAITSFNNNNNNINRKYNENSIYNHKYRGIGK